MAEYRGCDKCKHTGKALNEYPCNVCIHNAIDKFAPLTNADRIRNMTDEELAEFINMVANDSIDTMVGYKDYTEIWEDKDPTLQWLKSEVKE
jgi:hypothetical protein